MRSTIETKSPEGSDETRTATETILVVDDHPELCEVASLLLQCCGYRVLTARNGEEAIRIACENTNIDLLLTDVEMPVILGDELAEWFRVTRPETAVVFMSGNPMQQRRLEPCYFVEKPFIHLDRLLKTVRAAIDEHQTHTHHHTTSVAA
jgi:two-component system, cell cycle sensor histidine kinase and response regulator CckA